MRTDFWNVDYIGEEIPHDPVNITGVIIQYQDLLQIVSRFMDDFEMADIPLFTVTFSVKDVYGQHIDNAVISLGDYNNSPGDYVFENIPAGEHALAVSALCFETFTGVINVEANMEIGIELDYDILPGDATGDGIVNVLDIIAIANYFAGNEPNTFCFENADVNGDGLINILDLIAVTELFMGGTD